MSLDIKKKPLLQMFYCTFYCTCKHNVLHFTVAFYGTASLKTPSPLKCGTYFNMRLILYQSKV